MSDELEHENHGHSTAAWVSVTIMLVASFVACLAVVLANIPLFIVGMVVFVIGAFAWKVLTMAGYGNKNPVQPPGAVQTPAQH